MRARRTWTAPRVVATLAVVAVAGIAPGSAVAAGSGSSSNVETTNTETVQTYLNADGKINSSRIYEQLTLTGNGNVTVNNPVDPHGLRNLDGFGGLSADNGNLQQHYDVNGVARSRMVSTYDSAKLPLSIVPHYELDGRTVSASDLVGATGDVKVSYTVKNLTAKPEMLTYPNGSGGVKTESVKVPIPIVGTVVFDLPQSYTQVKSQAASMGGDGHGGTQMEYVLTLFPPIGSDTMTFGYTAKLQNGTVPAISFTGVPVDPLTNPTFTTAASSYKSGTKSGTQLASGATTINTNLLKLRDGAGQLLAGIIKLSNGADQLNTGLATQAAPGSRKLADGALQLNGGLAQIDNGADKLAGGTSQASTGGRKLVAGLGKLHHSLATLMPTLAKNKDYQQLLGGLTAIAAGVGNQNDTASDGTLIGGLNAIKQGLEVGPSNDCLSSAIAGVDPTNCGAIDALNALVSSVNLSRSQAPSDIVLGKLTIITEGALVKQITDIGNTTGCQSDPQCQSQVNALAGRFAAGTGDYDQQLKLLADQMTKVATTAHSQLTAPGAGLDQLIAGLSNPQASQDCAAAQKTPTTKDDCGIKQAALAVHAGIPLLVKALRDQILAGVGSATPGCDPTKTLACGAAALASGLGQLNAGTHKLAGGTAQALNGSAQLADGADQLSQGLDTAASGSGQLAGGLHQARAGAPKLENGANELSQRGVVKLVAAGTSTAQQYGKLYATLAEGAHRAHTDGMAYGAPTGAMGLTAYDFELSGSSGEGNQNVVRIIAAVALAGLGLGAFALRRRSPRILPGL